MKKIALLTVSLVILILFVIWRSDYTDSSKPLAQPTEISAEDLEKEASAISPIKREEKIPTHHSDIDRTK